jgi:starvation-inducible DNA-binding protein
MAKADIGLTPKQTEIIAKILSPLLADEFLLYLKTRNAHWNIEGPDFHTVHVYFEQLYTELEGVVDGVAERLRKIGHYAPATMKDYLQLTHLSEKRASKNNSLSFMKDLLADHDAIIVYLRESIVKLGKEVEHAYGTSDYLTTLMEQHETTAWMLRSHLK